MQTEIKTILQTPNWKHASFHFTIWDDMCSSPGVYWGEGYT